MGLEAPRAGRDRGFCGVELLVEGEAGQSRLMKEMDEMGIHGVGSRSGDFPEPPVVVGGTVLKVGALREEVDREGRGKVKEGDEDVSRLNEVEPLVAVEFHLSRVSPLLMVVPVLGEIREGSSSLVDENDKAEVYQVRFTRPRKVRETVLRGFV